MIRDNVYPKLFSWMGVIFRNQKLFCVASAYKLFRIKFMRHLFYSQWDHPVRHSPSCNVYNLKNGDNLKYSKKSE